MTKDEEWERVKKCYNCKNCINIGADRCFNKCNILWICVDCSPFECEGEYYEKKD